MRHSVQRWLFCAGAVTALGAAACMQVSPASAARVGSAGQAVPAGRAAPAGEAAAAAAYVPPTINLSLGNRGPAVRSVQRRLNALGYYAGPADGQYGQDLEEAVWAFKEVQGLPMNGGSSVITRAFRHALINPRPPHVLVANGGAGRIEINQSIQVLVLYRNNKPQLILHISSGGRYYFCNPPPNQSSCGYAITPDGNYKALSYLPGDIQVPLGYMENPVFFIGRAYAIHGGDAVPWYPASHGCVRIYDDVVNWFHKQVRIGVTRIYVRGKAPQYL
jgi:peptidoglycan hydrolase-like protein with peptidoglycan-binding domain